MTEKVRVKAEVEQRGLCEVEFDLEPEEAEAYLAAITPQERREILYAAAEEVAYTEDSWEMEVDCISAVLVPVEDSHG